MKLFIRIFIVLLLGSIFRGIVDDLLVAIGVKRRPPYGEAVWR